jgi:hypothetical protein
VDTSKRKPDLLSASRSVQDRGQRILASLEQGGKPVTLTRRAASRQLDSWIVGVSSVVMVLAAFAWVMHDSSVAPAPKRITWASARPAQAAQAAPPAAGMAQQQQQQASQAAAIVNEAPEHRAAHGAPAAASVLATASASTAASGPAIEPGLIAARASAVTEHSKASAARANASAAPAASAVNVASRAVGAAGPSAAARNGSPAPATSADTDVALLTALVAHSGRPATVTPERSRDVVERRDGDSSETLLARCKQLGLIEGMLCRSRICSGRWESDAACRAPDHERPLPAY